MIQDGRNIERTSIPLDRMEVEIISLADLMNLLNPITTDITNIDIRVTALENAPVIDGDDYVRRTGSIAEDITGNKTFNHNVVVQGNLNVTGTTTSVNSANMTITDNEVVLNNGETGAGVSLTVAGLRVDRGTATDYLIQYTESGGHFMAGLEGSLEQVAFISDIPSSTASDIDGGSGIFKANTTMTSITMSKDMGASYDVTVTPKLAAAGDISNVGAIYWVRVDNTHFNVYNTGSDNTTGFSWICRK